MAGTEGKQDGMHTACLLYGFRFEKHVSDLSAVSGLNLGHVKCEPFKKYCPYVIEAGELSLMWLNIAISFVFTVQGKALN